MANQESPSGGPVHYIPADRAAALRVELDSRWAAGHRVPAEEYVRQLPDSPAIDEDAVDLVIAEYLARERLGEKPDPAEFTRRFPKYATAIRDQIALHRAFVAAPATLTADGTEGTLSAAAGGGLPQLPLSFGRYTLLRVLGEGGMGVVYLAEDSQLGRQIALKVLHSDGLDTIATGRFRREARVAAALAHPNLCPVYDVGRADGVDYLTMPYLPGGTLATRVRRDGRLPEAEAVRLVHRVAAAMAAAHAAGVIHRDLKPGNILIDAAGEPVVTDFGLARRAAEGDPTLTGRGAILGTPSYLPPEQIGCAPEAAGPTADVYSLGVVLYELLTGRPPFQGNPSEVLRQVLSAEPPPPSTLRPGLDPRLEAVVLRAMAKDAGKRFPSMTAFAFALAELTGTSARPRRRWYLVAGSLAAAITVFTLIRSFWPAPVPKPDGSAVPLVETDPVRTGSRWAGQFRFGPPNDEPHTAELTVTSRDGAEFRGKYTSEGRYVWEVNGTVRGDQIRWTLSKALNQPALDTGATGNAFVDGVRRGNEIRATFRDPTDKSKAAMKLVLQE